MVLKLRNKELIVKFKANESFSVNYYLTKKDLNISLTTDHAHGDISKSKNRCYASTSKMPSRCKRGLDEQESSDATNIAAVNGNSVVTNGNSNMDTMETESSDTTKRQQTEKHTGD